MGRVASLPHHSIHLDYICMIFFTSSSVASIGSLSKRWSQCPCTKASPQESVAEEPRELACPSPLLYRINELISSQNAFRPIEKRRKTAAPRPHWPRRAAREAPRGSSPRAAPWPQPSTAAPAALALARRRASPRRDRPPPLASLG